MKKQTRKNNTATETETSKRDTSPYVPQKEKINFDLKIRELPWSEKQKNLIDTIADKNTKVVLIKGLCGTGKTAVAVYSALKALEQKKVGQIIYTRIPVESSVHTLGFLKGDLNEKMTPYLMPLYDKLHEFLTPASITKLEKEERFIGIPIGHLRGRSFDAVYVLGDEFQNANREDILLAMTRMGKFSKLILFGDAMQSDIKNSAFTHVFDAFSNLESREKGIFTFEFGKEDIFRSEILSFIVGKFEELGKILK